MKGSSFPILKHSLINCHSIMEKRPRKFLSKLLMYYEFFLGSITQKHLVIFDVILDFWACFFFFFHEERIYFPLG